MRLFEVVEEPIQIPNYIDAVLHTGAGAVTVFIGHVGEWTYGGSHTFSFV